MGIPDIPRDKAELLSTLLEAILYGKHPPGVNHLGVNMLNDLRALAADVRGDDLGNGVSTD